MESYKKDMEMARRIAKIVSSDGGTVYYVGGCVRDWLLGKSNKDIDIEVHGVYPARLAEILDSLGQRMTIGESFGIFGLKGYSLDIAMPRKEKVRGSGHKDFDVSVDPFIGTRKAAMRRDFTINAMMQDVLTDEIVDEFDGRGDLDKGLIRHVSAETFIEDELRVLRAAQFAARFDFRVADETIELCRGMSLEHLPQERIMGELEKALLKADRPSVFFETLREMEQLSVWFPELQDLIGVEQNRNYHLEGDVWTHTMMVLDAAASLREKAKNPLGYMLAALTHDLGKIVATEVKDGVVHAYQHEKKGLPLAEAMTVRITHEKKLIQYVLNMTEYHMRPHMAAEDHSSVKATNKMFDCSVEPEDLILLAEADNRGQISPRGPVSDTAFLEERLKIYREYMSRPFVMGRDLVEAGLKPGEEFTGYLKLAHKLRLAGVPKDQAMKQILAEARTDSE